MTKCLIIGSGIVGLITAYELKKSGCDVTIIDKQKPGQSSMSAAGILFPLEPWENKKYMQDLCIAGHNEYNKFFSNFTSLEKDKIGYEKKSILLFGEKIDLARDWYKERTDIKSKYTNEMLNTVENSIKEKYEKFLQIPDISIINPGKFLFFLRDLLSKSGVNFSNEEIDKLDKFLKKKDNHLYDFIIVSAGSWSNSILDKKNIKMKPIKGQLLHIKTNKKLINNILIYNNYYIAQRKDNEIVVGATLEDVGFDTELTESGKNFLEKSLSDLFLEKIEIFNIEQTFGFRPHADKNEPYVCLDPCNKKIIYNFGHYRYGILTAIPSAKIVKRLVS